MQDTIIDELFKRNKELIDYLEQKKQLTFYIDEKNNFSKILVLAIGSYFESILCEMIIELAKKSSSKPVCHLVRNKAIMRQYHTYFDWEKENANKFFSLFGDDFKKNSLTKIGKDKDLNEAIKAFLKLGYERNKLIHMNLAAYVLDNTLEDYYDLYKKSLKFIDFVRSQLIEE
jgi:hypothetical protein